MALPRIFVSSTYYDLKHIRENTGTLPVFIDLPLLISFQSFLKEIIDIST